MEAGAEAAAAGASNTFTSDTSLPSTSSISDASEKSNSPENKNRIKNAREKWDSLKQGKNSRAVDRLSAAGKKAALSMVEGLAKDYPQKPGTAANTAG
jgi:hypothetical protein